MAKIFGSWSELVSIIFREDGQNLTFRPNQSTSYNTDITIELPPGNNAAILVGEDNTQTLSNKSIDADQNTITNIDNADIKAGADIDRSKIDAGTADHVLINDGSGEFSSEATLAKSRGGTGQDNTNVTFPATGTLVTEDATQPLSNKTIDDSTILVPDTDFSDSTDQTKEVGIDVSGADPSTKTTLSFGQDANRTITVPNADDTLVGRATTDTLSGKSFSDPEVDFTGSGAINIPDGNTAARPVSPSTGALRFNSELSQFEGYDGSAWGEIAGGSGQGGVNYLTNGDFESGVGGWTVTGTGSPTFTVETGTNVGRGAQSGDWEIPASAVAGDKLESDAFTIDNADVNKRMLVKFTYKTDYPSTEPDVLVKIIADPSGSPTEIIPSSVQIFNSDTGFSQYQAIWDSTSETEYALRLEVGASPNATSHVYVDDMLVGPGDVTQNVAVGPWQDYTPTFQGFGTVTDIDFRWRRVGESIEIMGDWTNGTVSVTEAQISLPESLTVGTGNPSTLAVGWIESTDSGETRNYVPLATDGDTFLNFGLQRYDSGFNGLTALNGNSLQSSERFSLYATVQVQEYTGSGVLYELVEENLTEWSSPETLELLGSSSGSGSGTVVWRRVGDSMELRGHFTSIGTCAGNVYATIPEGLNVDDSKFPVSSPNALGHGFTQNDTIRQGIDIFNPTSTQIGFTYQESQDSFSSGDSVITNFAYLIFHAKVPITEWAGAQPSLVGFAKATSNKLGLVTLSDLGGQGEINYISNFDFESDNSDWSTSGAGLTFSQTTTAANVGRGTGSADLAFTASAAAGTSYLQSSTFSLDNSDLNKLMKASFTYKTAYGATEPDFKVYLIEDPDGSPVKHEASIFDLIASDTGFSQYEATWVSTDTEEWALRFEVGTGSPTAGNLYFDNVIVGPGKVVQGAAVNETKDLDVTLSPGFGTTSNEKITYQRVGDKMHVQGYFQSGTHTGTNAYIDLDDFTIDFSKLSTELQVNQVGMWSVLRDAAGTSQLFSTDKSGVIFCDDANPSRVLFADFTEGTRTFGNTGVTGIQA